MRTICLLLLCLPLLAFGQKIYKHVDEDGNVSFSDEPPSDDAVEVVLPPISVVETGGAERGAATRPERDDEARGDGRRVSYDGLAIVAPQAEQTFFAAEGAVRMSVTAGRPLVQGHQYRVFLDGRQIAETTNTAMMLDGIVRGAHVTYVQIVDAGGRVLQTSEPITFYMRQPSVNLPARQGANAARPQNRGGG